MRPGQGGDQASALGDAIKALLSPIVGEFVSRTSLNMAAKRVGKSPESISKTDLPGLAEALQPALRTLVGVPAADSLVAQIKALRDA